MNTALIIGHPGHELGVWGWVNNTHPLVAVLTDGSGYKNQSRLPLSKVFFQQNNASISPLCGLVTDRDIYRAILERNFNFFLQWSDKLVELFIQEDIQCVVGDALEGYNPTHDLCRLMIDRAANIVADRHHLIKNYEFNLAGRPKPQLLPTDHICIDLSPLDLLRKLRDVRTYAAATGGVLVSEVERLIQSHGEAIYGQEFLVPTTSESQLARFEHETPFYETYGAQQVVRGHYHSVIRYHEHMVPIVHALHVKEQY